MKFTRLLALTVAMVFACASVGFADDAQSFAKRIDSFNYLVDQSGSMMMGYKGGKTSKIALAKQAMARVNDAVPELGYSGGLYTFAPYGTVVKQGEWNRASMAAGINKIKDEQPIFGRLTPMGPGLVEHTPVISDMAKKAGVIIVSDGAANRGVDPVAEAKAIYAANPDVCFHIISLADTAEGQEVLKAIADLTPCSVMVDAADLVQNDAAVDKFVLDVFCMPLKEEVIVLRGVHFAYDSTELKAPARAVLDEAANYLQKNPNKKLALLGYTDSTGSDAYNLGLSQRRADAVRNYLIEKGVNGSMLSTRGMGKSFTYDNATSEGRAMNRRCELVYEN